METLKFFMENTNIQQAGTGRDLFFYLLLFFTLTLSAISAGGILFQVVNHYWSDIVVNYNQAVTSGALQWSLACFIVSSPVFLWANWKINKDTKAGLSSLNSAVRRVIIYLALFIASAVVIGDIIGLVFNFVGGQLTIRFILKVVIILFLGGWINCYYWSELRGSQIIPKKWQAYFLIGFSMVLLVVGFLLAGNPLEQQKIVRDQKRLNDLQQLSYAIQNYYETSQPQALPGSLAAITAAGYYDWQPIDPLTKQSYRYDKQSEQTYSLCANFENQSDKQPGEIFMGPGRMNWSHPAGDYCFEMKVFNNDFVK